MHGLDPARKPPTVPEYLDCVHPQDRESMANLIKGLSAKASPFVLAPETAPNRAVGALQKLPLADKGIGPAGFAFSWI
jgi:hypothetical protein